MKTAFCIFFLVFASAFARDEDIKSVSELSKKIIQSISEDNFEALLDLLPTPDVIRQLSPDEFGPMSDEEILHRIRGNEKLRQDFDYIISSAKELNYDLKTLSYVSQSLEEAETPEAPFAVTIIYSIEGKRGELAYVALYRERKFYFLDILISFQLFQKAK